jgi:tetratricopeptide (TPR) repeat protein
MSSSLIAQNTTSEKQLVEQEKKIRIVKAKTKEKKVVTNYNLANTIYKNKKYNEAKLFYKISKELSKNKKEKHKTLHNLGNVYMKEKQYDKAVKTYKEALRNNPKDEETRYNLALAKELLKKNPPKPKPKNKDNKKQNKEDKDNPKNNKDNKNKDKKEEPKQDKKPQGANKQRIDNLLDAVAKDEKRVQEKINANKKRAKIVETDKDW